MKDKTAPIIKHILMLAVILPVLGVLNQCAVMNPQKGMNVVVHLQRDNLPDSTILIFNLGEPGYAGGAGKKVAELFHLGFLHYRAFKVASLYSDSPWDRIADNEEERLMLALQEAKEKNFDYILVGDLREFFYGAINPSRVNMKVRVIEVESRATIFLANHYMEHQGRDPNYPMQTKFSKQSAEPVKLAELMVDMFIRKLIKENKK
jgi:hypothetical protein